LFLLRSSQEEPYQTDRSVDLYAGLLPHELESLDRSVIRAG